MGPLAAPPKGVPTDAASRDESALRRLVVATLSECLVDGAFSELIAARVDHWFAGGGGPSPITLLPAWTCAGHGGDAARAASLCAAWALVRLAAKLFDDVEDGDVRERLAIEVNGATGVLALAHLAVQALERAGVPAERVYHVEGALSRAILRAAGGQHRDLVTRYKVARDEVATTPERLDPDVWLEIAVAKSGVLFAWTTWAGAAVAPTARLGSRRLAGYRDYGEHLGVLIQIADDYNDVWPGGAIAADAPLDGPNLAVAYALTAAEGPARLRLLDRMRDARAGVPGAGAEARATITDLGAQAFVLAAALARRRQAAEAMAVARPQPNVREDLASVLDHVMPVLRHIGSL